ncbi:lysozyme inhibitor LprI family protein [uncultured Erythrobacter sp.]|uniref:lysozyme inhibitor LprI family protein n=1 Tax=uncultured Erythrobacter sp. TaxID=263913 RepID=UPI00262C8FFB|nr:lysozyme inhibitor LprI family protein [uncultured Erythrobacter sp.]
MISALLLLLAQSDGFPECNQEAADRGIQQEMNICAAVEFRKADAELNAQWNVTSQKMKEFDESWTAEWDDRPGWFASLLEAQRAWIAFRDAHCRVDGYTARGGSLEPLLVSTCKTALTEARTEQLRELAESPN